MAVSLGRRREAVPEPLFPHHEFGWGQEQVLPEQPCDAFYPKKQPYFKDFVIIG